MSKALTSADIEKVVKHVTEQALADFAENSFNSVLQLIAERFDAIEIRLDRIEDRLDRIEVRLDRVEDRLDRVEARLDSIESRLDVMEEKDQRHNFALERLFKGQAEHDDRLDSHQIKLHKLIKQSN